MKQLNQTELSRVSGAIDSATNATLLNSAVSAVGAIGTAVAGAAGAFLGGAVGTGISKIIESQFANANQTVGESIIGDFEGML